MNDNYLPEEWITRHHPIDDIEPDLKREDAIRDARMKCVSLLNAFAAHIESALLRPGATLQDVAVAFYQPVYALGLNIAGGMSVTERADIWEVERATFSKGMVSFCAGNGLGPSFYMKKEESHDAYRSSRIKSIKNASKTRQR